MLQGRRETIADLDCVLVSSGATPKVPVFILHGYGDSADGLAHLSAEWVSRLGDVAPLLEFVFPSAPGSLAAMGMPDGRAWWPINMAGLMEMFDTGSFEELHEHSPPGIDEARGQIERLIHEVIGRLQPDVAKPRYALGGFSQGAMLSMDVALRGEVPIPELLFQFSGTLVCRPEWQMAMQRLENTLVVQSHGRQDMVLPFSGAKNLHDAIIPGGATLQWVPFNGPHTIPPVALDTSAEAIRQRFQRMSRSE